MNKIRFDRFIYKLKANIAYLYVENKSKIKFFIIMLVIGIILGSIFSFSSKNILIFKGDGNYLIYIFSKSYKPGTYFLMRFFYSLLNIFILSIFCLHYRLVFLHYVFFIFRGVYLSCTFVYIIKTYAFLGIIGGVFIFLPMQCVFLIGLLICSLIGIDYSRTCFCFNMNNFLHLLLKFLLVFCIISLSILIDILLIGICIIPFI